MNDAPQIYKGEFYINWSPPGRAHVELTTRPVTAWASLRPSVAEPLIAETAAFIEREEDRDLSGAALSTSQRTENEALAAVWRGYFGFESESSGYDSIYGSTGSSGISAVGSGGGGYSAGGASYRGVDKVNAGDIMSHIDSIIDDYDFPTTRLSEQESDLNYLSGQEETHEDLLSTQTSGDGVYVQPHVSTRAGHFFIGGKPISTTYSRPESCLLSMFLEKYAPIIGKKLKSGHSPHMTYDGLYRLAGLGPAPETGPLPCSLFAAENWFAKWHIKVRVIDAQGGIVYSYTPKNRSAAKKGMLVWRLLAADRHIWECNNCEHEFDQLYGGSKANHKTTELTGERPLPRRSLDNSELEEVNEEVSTAQLHSLKPSTEWRHVGGKETAAFALVDNAADVLAAIEKFNLSNKVAKKKNSTKCDLKLITCVEPGDIAVELFDLHNIIPGDALLALGTIEAFNARVGMTVAKISRAVDVNTRGDQPIVREQFSIDSLTRYNEELLKLRHAFTPRSAVSRYSKSFLNAFESYPRGPVTGRIASADVDTNQVSCCIDVGRAYTGFLATQGLKIPIYGLFDEYITVTEQPETFEMYNWYIIHVDYDNRDQVLFPTAYTNVPGHVLTYAKNIKNIKFTVLKMISPHAFESCDGPQLIRSLYASPPNWGEGTQDSESTSVGISDTAAKSLANIAFGQCAKRENKKQIASFHRYPDEALATGGFIHKFGENGYLAVQSGKSTLTEGFLPMGRMVIEMMRVMLHQMVGALTDARIPCIGVRTDCVYVAMEHQTRARIALKKVDFKFQDELGINGDPVSNWDRRVHCLRVDHAPSRLGLILPVEKSLLPVETWEPDTPNVVERFNIEDERDIETADELMRDARLDGEDPLRLAIEATVPGAGKTFLVLESARRAGTLPITLIVTPWNRLSSEMIKQGAQACTLYALLGKCPEMAPTEDLIEEEDEFKPKSGKDISGIVRIHFEEPYLYTVHQLEWMVTFIRNNPTMNFTMAGDPGQLSPPGQHLAKDYDTYYEYIMGLVFPRRLTLRESKRCNNPEAMQWLCQDLKYEFKSVRDIMFDNCIRTINRSELTAEDFAIDESTGKRHAHLCAYRNTAAFVNDFAHVRVGDTELHEYAAGQELLGIGSATCKGGRINSNESYTVISQTIDRLVLNTMNGSVRDITKKAARRFLSRAYCATCHSAQGLSLGMTLYIHDAFTYMTDHRWFRTAVSRCGSLNIILVTTDQQAPRINPVRIETLITTASRQDSAAGYKWDKKNYFDLDWISTTLTEQKWLCSRCSCDMTKYFVRRINTNRPHTKSNCSLICPDCALTSPL
jgi:hypothetical protein